MKKLLAATASVLALLAGHVDAANLTPPNLTAATTINNADLLLVWPSGSGGPLEAVQFSVLKTLMQTALGSGYLVPGNNLSDVLSPSTARLNLGLGSAAGYNVGTGGAFVPVLNGANNWSAPQAWAQGTTSNPSYYIPNGTLTNTPQDNAFEWDGTSFWGTTSSGVRTAFVWSNDGRFTGIVQDIRSSSYTFALSDAGAQVFHPSSDATARTLTIPAHTSVNFVVGSKIEIVNDCGAGAITLQITTDTLEWLPFNLTGTRTLAACSDVTITKLTASEWSITGMGLT